MEKREEFYKRSEHGGIRGSKVTHPEGSQSIYEISCLPVKRIDMAKYYSIKDCTVSNILKCIYNRSKTIVKKRRKKRKLLASDMSLF